VAGGLANVLRRTSRSPEPPINITELPSHNLSGVKHEPGQQTQHGIVVTPVRRRAIATVKHGLGIDSLQDL